VEYLPIVKHLYDAGYSILFYDHRGQDESDGGYDKYTFDTATGKNDIETIIDATPTEEIIWVGKNESTHLEMISVLMGKNEARLFGNDQRFDGK
jgi:predicted alpha/beta hydrolase